ncbi:MAG: hypothetical protein AABY22_09345 [Nanoarchaeota archaeon]
MSFILFNKFNKKDAKKLLTDMEEWFKNNPKRRVCYTDLFKIRRNHIKEDILKHCLPEVKL